MSVDPEDAAWAAAEFDRAEQERAAEATLAEIAAARAAQERHAVARQVHIRASGAARLADTTGPHPRGLHVPCAGERGADGEVISKGCGRPAGFGCEHPSGRTPAGFVHPSRLDAERRWWEGIASVPGAG